MQNPHRAPLYREALFLLGLALLALCALESCSELGAWDIAARGPKAHEIATTPAPGGGSGGDSTTTPDTIVCKKRVKISLNNIYESEALTNFPLLVRLDSTRIDYSLCSSGGADIRFKDSTGSTSLPYEIESWNASGSSYIWVRVPNISSTTDYIWLYFSSDNPNDRSDPTGVWANNGYVIVCHGANTSTESTGNHRASSSGYSAAGILAAKIGYGFNFTGTNQGIVIPTKTDISNLGPITIEAWVYDYGSQAGQKLISKGPFALSVANSQELSLSVGYDGSNYVATSPSLWTTGTWENIALVWNGSTTSTFYSHGIGNDVTTSTRSGTRVSDLSSSLIIGNDSPSNPGLNAVLDELRISNVVRDSAWLMAQYRSQSDASLTFGTAEDVP